MTVLEFIDALVHSRIPFAVEFVGEGMGPHRGAVVVINTKWLNRELINILATYEPNYGTFGNEIRVVFSQAED